MRRPIRSKGNDNESVSLPQHQNLNGSPGLAESMIEGEYNKYGDHSDDDEYFVSDDDASYRQRSRSYGDAEDILLNSGYYESFEMETRTDLPTDQHDENRKSIIGSSVKSSRSNANHSEGLHHRTNKATGNNNSNASGIHHRALPSRMRQQHSPPAPRQTPIGYDFYRTPTPKRKPSHPGYPILNTFQANGIHHHNNHYHSTFWKPSSFLKFCLAFGFGSYVFLLIRSSLWLLDRASNNIYDNSNYGNSIYDHGSRFDITDRATTRSNWVSDWTPSWSEERRTLRQESRLRMEGRAKDRRLKTRPPRNSAVPTSLTTSTWYLMNRMPTKSTNQSPSDSFRPQFPQSALASLDMLCGFHAQNASLAHPQNYLNDRALNAKSARVFITGILNPVGFHLAMHLHQHCGVQVIGGMDTMYPNTVENRMQLQERLQLLHSSIPKLVKPIVLPFIGLDPKGNSDKKGSNEMGQEYDFISWKPTHIVHLASYANEVYSDAAVNPTWRNPHSPYVESTEANGDNMQPKRSFMYQVRSNIVSMEQILQRLAKVPADERPHFLYASAATKIADKNNVEYDGPHHALHKATKNIDEVLARTYRMPSIAVRLPNAIYGPWGDSGSMVHDLMEEALTQWNSTATNNVDPVNLMTKLQGIRMLDLLYVDDVVEALVAAMQYQPRHPIATQLSSGLETPASFIAEIVRSFPPAVSSQRNIRSNMNPDNANFTENSRRLAVGEEQEAIWKWNPQTSLQDGMVQTMGWHLYRHSPFGPSIEAADTFLERHNQATCAADNWHCHKSAKFLPCASECSTRKQCVPSVFDEVRVLTRNVTEGCDYVLYTQSLGYNVEELELGAEYMDDKDLDDDVKLVCNLAFVPRDSDLVASSIAKVPNEQLAQFGIKPEQSSDGVNMRERKLDGLNGRLLVHGWILVWVRDAMDELTATDKSLLKLSPGQFFSSEVSHAIFVEENFSVSPDLEDVLFLIGEMKRKALPKRALKKDVLIKTHMGRPVTKRKKFKLPAEPKRRAAILFAPLRFPNDHHNPTIQRYKSGERKLTVHDAAKFMRYELDQDPTSEKEPIEIRRQREFYERVPSYINRNSELRSTMEPWYRYTMRHWVRTRWVVHDLNLEESRLLRCDWYQEHIAWGSDLDQLSFAHIMAIRELKRRIAHDEPDDHIKTFIEQHPDLKELTDSYEWHSMETDSNKLHREPVMWTSELPDHVTVEDEQLADDVLSEKHSKEPVPLFVRIMSERVMAAARKIWSKERKKEQKKKHK